MHLRKNWVPGIVHRKISVVNYELKANGTLCVEHVDEMFRNCIKSSFVLTIAIIYGLRI